MHQSIALWAHPRSLSTAFERSFIERGDFTVFHEPFSYLYFMHEQRADIPYKHTDSNHPETYPEIRDMMENVRKERQVFHKDMCYHALQHLLLDRRYLENQVHTFIIRDPDETILSHATINPELSMKVLGYKEMVELFNFLKRLNNKAPVVVNAADLQLNPTGTMAAYCNAIGIEYRPETLQWDAGIRPEWSTWREWHSNVEASRGIQRANKRYKVTFQQAPHLREFADYCRPLYESMDQYKITPMKDVTI